MGCSRFFVSQQKSLILPSVTLAFAMAAKDTRQVRTVILEELNQDYVTGARARGVKEWKILWRNVFPNSLLPLITMLGLSLGYVLDDTAVVEVIFTNPGLVNLAVDISYSYVDPRMREKRRWPVFWAPASGTP